MTYHIDLTRLIYQIRYGPSFFKYKKCSTDSIPFNSVRFYMVLEDPFNFLKSSL